MGGMDSRGRLHGKAAIITGGEGSIGMATARAFAAEGARVGLVGLVEDELRAGLPSSVTRRSGRPSTRWSG